MKSDINPQEIHLAAAKILISKCVGTGASLMGFYRIHLLEIITVDFLIVPILMTGGGLLTLIIFFTGMTAIAKEDNCWLLAFSILTSLNFLVLLAGVISSIRSGSGRSWRQ